MSFKSSFVRVIPLIKIIKVKIPVTHMYADIHIKWRKGSVLLSWFIGKMPKYNFNFSNKPVYWVTPQQKR